VYSGDRTGTGRVQLWPGAEDGERKQIVAAGKQLIFISSECPNSAESREASFRPR